MNETENSLRASKLGRPLSIVIAKCRIRHTPIVQNLHKNAINRITWYKAFGVAHFCWKALQLTSGSGFAKIKRNQDWNQAAYGKTLPAP